jgi:hypothetical protein
MMVEPQGRGPRDRGNCCERRGKGKRFRTDGNGLRRAHLEPLAHVQKAPAIYPFTGICLNGDQAENASKRR